MINFREYSEKIRQENKIDKDLIYILEKELLHYEMLSALYEGGLLEDLTLHGGTALRICHGALRYSENLNFNCTPSFNKEKFSRIGECLKEAVATKFRIDLEVRKPKQFKEKNKINTWNMVLIKKPINKSIPLQEIKIDIAEIPSYNVEQKPLINHYKGTVDLDNGAIINVSSIDEIFANKLISFPSESSVRDKDIWDINRLYMAGYKPSLPLILRKIEDHSIKKEDYLKNLYSKKNTIADRIDDPLFAKQLSRFLNKEILDETVREEMWIDYTKESLVKEFGSLYDKIKNGETDKPDPYSIFDIPSR